MLGRKNWIHIGSQHAGPKVAVILSIVECETKRRHFLEMTQEHDCCVLVDILEDGDASPIYYVVPTQRKYVWLLPLNVPVRGFLKPGNHAGPASEKLKR